MSQQKWTRNPPRKEYLIPIDMAHYIPTNGWWHIWVKIGRDPKIINSSREDPFALTMIDLFGSPIPIDASQRRESVGSPGVGGGGWEDREGCASGYGLY